MKCRKRNLICSLIFSLTVLSGCNNSESVKTEEQYNCPSVDGKFEASFRIETRSIFGPANYYMTVQVKDLLKDSEVVILEMNHGYDVGLQWAKSGRLTITYPRGAGINKYQGYYAGRYKGETELTFEEAKDGKFTIFKGGCLDSLD